MHASESVDSPISYFGQKMALRLSLDSKEYDIGIRRSRCSEEACIRKALAAEKNGAPWIGTWWNVARKQDTVLSGSEF